MSQPDPFPSYLDPSLHSDFNPGGPPMDPISPDTFYGIPSGASSASCNNTLPLHPPLCSLPQGFSSGTSSANPSRPPSPTVGIKIKAKGKKREFSNTDLDQLLHTTIEVNPFTAPRNLIGEAWKEVTRKAQPPRQQGTAWVMMLTHARTVSEHWLTGVK